MQNKTPAHVGITPLTRENHQFDGYSVRIQRRRIKFTSFFSASKLNYRPSMTKKERFAVALDKAKKARKDLLMILVQDKSWGPHYDVLTEKAAQKITDLGFKIKRAK